MDVRMIDLEGDITRLALAGRLDAEGVGDIEAPFRAVVADRGKPAIVDFSGVEFMASIGMRLIIQVAKTLSANGARLVILRPRPLVAEVLAIAGLTSLTPVAQDEVRAEALARGEDGP